jgi:hypothetical protein
MRRQTNDPEYNRGYDAVLNAIKLGSDVQELYDQAEGSYTDDAFDKGWKDSCVDNGGSDAF